MKNTLLKNIAHLFYSTILANVLNATTLILLAHFFQAANYGTFSIALAIALIMHFFTDLGISNTFLREGSKKAALDRTFATYVKLRLISLVVTLCGFGIALLFIYDEAQTIQMIYSLIFPMVIGLFLQSIGITYFQLLEKMYYIAFIKIFSSVLLVFVVFICMFTDVNVYLAAFAYGAAYFFGGVFSIYLLMKKAVFSWKTPFQKQLLQKLTPFFVSGLFIMLIPQLGPLVLEKTLPLALVGLFAVAFRIPSALYQIPGVIAGAFFPLLFKHFNAGDLAGHARLHLLQLKLMGLVGMGMTLGLFYLAGNLVRVLFGAAWHDAVLPLQILAFIIVFQGFNIATADALTTRGRQGARTFVQLLTIVTGIISLYFLSIAYGVVGAAVAIVLMEIVAFLGYMIASPTRKFALTKVILPYGLSFITVSYLIHFWLNTYPFIALIITILLIAVVILLIDQSVREKVRGVLQEKRVSQYESHGGQRKNG